ncbi:MAG: hypothetical protein BMS9Abin20_1063 [Acidimicrobiia bacterium]|nr:MAG: hypothetical protein BMS9Abin20_1063 [Acidimicrobiia bacterium]
MNDLYIRMREGLSEPMDETVTSRQRAEIDQALVDFVPAPRRRRRWRTALILAAGVLVIPAAALASNGALPGDALYPIKQATEQVVGLVDSDVVATHRVDELAVLIDRQTDQLVIDKAITDASIAVDPLPRDHPLRDQLDRLTDRVTDVRRAHEAPTDAKVTDTEKDRPTVDTQPLHDVTPTTTATITDERPTDTTGSHPAPTTDEQPTDTTRSDPAPTRDQPPSTDETSGQD